MQKIKKIGWAKLKIWLNHFYSGKNFTFWPQKSCSKSFIHQSKSLKGKDIHAKIKKNGWAALKIWLNQPKLGKILTFDLMSPANKNFQTYEIYLSLIPPFGLDQAKYEINLMSSFWDIWKNIDFYAQNETFWTLAGGP